MRFPTNNRNHHRQHRQHRHHDSCHHNSIQHSCHSCNHRLTTTNTTRTTPPPHPLHGASQGDNGPPGRTLDGHGKQSYGGHSVGETPGPIPNPEAKTHSADGTAPERVWESRTPPDNTSQAEAPHHQVRGLTPLTPQPHQQVGPHQRPTHQPGPKAYTRPAQAPSTRPKGPRPATNTARPKAHGPPAGDQPRHHALGQPGHRKRPAGQQHPTAPGAGHQPCEHPAHHSASKVRTGRLVSSRLGSAWLGLARLGLARLGPSRLGPHSLPTRMTTPG
jgi:hypothetical protein